MPDAQFFPRGIRTRGATIQGPLVLSSGIDFPLSTGSTTDVDLVVGTVHVIITTSDGGYRFLDPPSPVGINLRVVRGGTTATTSYFVPDATGVHIYTSSGSTGGRLITVSGGGSFELYALTTAAWVVAHSRGNVACTSST